MAHGAFCLNWPGIVPFSGFVFKPHGRHIGIYSTWCRHTHRSTAVQVTTITKYKFD